jgi:hypothetical protein
MSEHVIEHGESKVIAYFAYQNSRKRIILSPFCWSYRIEV